MASKLHHLQLHKAKHCKLMSELTILKPTKVLKERTMISAKRIVQLAKKWQRMAALGRKRLSWGMLKEAGECGTTMVSKGHCVVYTVDRTRFEVPLAYLGTAIFAELLWMSQEEFGFASNGHIMLPCDATVMEYAIFLLRRSASAEVEKAFLSTMALPCHYASCVTPTLGLSQQFSVYSC